MKHKLILLSALVLSGTLLSTSCSQQKEIVEPNFALRAGSTNADTANPNYGTGLERGKADVKALFESLTYVGNCGSTPGTQFPGQDNGGGGGTGGGGGNTGGGPTVEDPKDTEFTPPSQGCRYWNSPNGPDQFSYNIEGWKTSTEEHYPLARDADELAYYQGYYQGLVDGKAETRF